MTNSTTTRACRIGTVDLPERIDRERYFRDLSYLELSALFAGPIKPSSLDKWATAPAASIGLVAPWVLTHKKPPHATRSWAHDDTVGEFRDSAPARAALAALREASDRLSAACIVFRSPPLYAPSAANRDQLRRFFGELATTDTLGTTRVWVPDGLWDVRAAIAFAAELGVVAAFDPLVREPAQPPDVYFDLDVSALYLRVTGLGRTGPLRSERMEDLVALVEHYEELPITVAFESPSRWQDARNLMKALENASDDA